MSGETQRPAVWVGHVVLETDRMQETARFMRTIGMRPVFEGPSVSIFELRGGTHLIVMAKAQVTPGDASFDLMVEDLHASHRQFAALGLQPGPIESVPAISHERFTLREPAGHTISFFSSHVTGPV